MRHGDESLMSELKQVLKNVCGNHAYKNLLYQQNLIDLTYHSTKMEGNTLDRDDTVLLLRDKVVPEGKDEIWSKMSEDHHAALLRIAEDAYNPLHKLAPSYLQLISGMVLSRASSVRNTAKGNYDESKTDLRFHNVHAHGEYFLSYSNLYDATNEFVKKVNGLISDIKKSSDPVPLVIRLAIFCHFSIIKIHPFSDGNGRTARLIMNYILLKYDLPLLVVDSEARVQYITALKACQVNNDMDPFILFMIRQYLRSLKDYRILVTL
jgi:Fic family protein